MPTPNDIEYMCKLNGAIFKKPCTVTQCFAHMSNLAQSNVKPIAQTNCSHADFALNGFSENLDYAVEEQGFVGFRDLQYLSPFLNVNANDLREIYTNNVALMRKAISILWAAKDNNTHYCRHCGYPLKDKTIYQCRSATTCATRADVISTVVDIVIKVIPQENHASVFNVLWRSRVEKFSPPISLTEEEQHAISDL